MRQGWGDLMAEIQNSTYLEFVGHGTTTAGTVKEAWGLTDADISDAGSGWLINVAIVLDRANDPTHLLAGDWASRQQTLGTMTQAQLWETYGADETNYNEVMAYLNGANPQNLQYTVLGDSGTGGDYVTSAESRTIWVQLDAGAFSDLFNKTLKLVDSASYEFVFWDGNLHLPDSWNVRGLWVDGADVPPPIDQAPTNSYTPPQGYQSIGNSLYDIGEDKDVRPQNAATDYYNFPLNGEDVQTGAIAFVEPGIGSALPADATETFQDRLEAYRTHVGVTGTGTAYAQGTSGQSYATSGGGGERSLDVGIATAINPNSDIGLYVGSGYNGNAYASTFTAYQSAVWQTPDDAPVGWTTPEVVSSSWGDFQNPSPDSPFYRAYRELFVDAALMNQSVFTALGDGGSGNALANGLTNVTYNYASPFTTLVGGTSLSTAVSAERDTTLTSLLQLATQGDQAVLWRLIQGGLDMLPQDGTAATTFIEAVWNEYQIEGTDVTQGFQDHNATSGGVDTTQATPTYQLDYGLTPTTDNSPYTGQGRGLPDVAANAGGNMFYLTPNGDMKGLTGEGGTSAATPVWASLAVQFNAIFADQGLPQLGYMNDLLYIASAIAPGSFNDVTYGNNIASYSLGGDYTSSGQAVTPTGYGFEAESGYDLVTGLGSPNGTLLARALTSIAHAQMYFPLEPDVIVQLAVDPSDPDSPTINVSGAAQNLLFQPIFATDQDWSLTLGSSAVTFSGAQSSAYAWTNQFAQQTLQSDFSSDLVTMFDAQPHGTVYQADVAVGDSVVVSIRGEATALPQINLTTPFGFVDFISADADSAIQVARPIAIAETAGGADDQDVVVRMRQNGTNSSTVTFYKVDDFNGDIGSLHPGDAGYAAAVAARAYYTDSGTTSVTGAGYGQYSQTELVGVDAGDLVAMMLTSGGHTYYAFAQANETVDGQSVGHIWSYGLNTWGWEDLYGGGDQDFNDLVVQLDFTSAAGSGWLV